MTTPLLSIPLTQCTPPFARTLPYIVADIGPNWCVSADRATNLRALRSLVDTAVVAGASCVKVQLKGKGYYSREDLTAPITDVRSPFTTRGEYVAAREPDASVLSALSAWCDDRIEWSATPFDVESTELLAQFPTPFVKVASASVTDLALIDAICALVRPVVMSRGMSTVQELDAAVSVIGQRVPLTILHCVSAYPANNSDIDLRAMASCAERYPHAAIGYSGHERGLQISIAAAALGASLIERHITLDRSAWGPDHAASLEPDGLMRLVRDTRAAAYSARSGDGALRVLPCEEPARKRLRRV